MGDSKLLCPCKQRRKCAFCGKSRKEVAQIVTNGAVTICNECVGMAVEMIAAEKAKGDDDETG